MADALPLPPVLAGDERFQTLGKLAARISDIDRSPVLVYLIDQVNASALPHLAEQLHLLGEGWQFARDDDERRKLLKRAVELHRYKGTPWAIQQVLETLALSGQISEWFQYGGQPYHFKINVDLSTRGIDEATFDALVALITEYKNVRSHLELLSLSLINRSPVPSIAAATLGGEVTTVYPYQLTDLNQNSALQLGIAHWSVETVTVYPGP
ncbi:phage tail protein I [Laribacter hongkongensis]|uniref:phage tail protein I n=1 Tax=Laribacter hongkongensis TaxID=168471 RepID=UPI001EFDA2B0|nr:phage tail protein I [Laribacter hongkongensis]MCG8993333.1 phage tail protein I [Laribacter hongkongensis]MCG8997691.1 phage tail protein I [Laribacter hongkongensis]MCG9001446.1 phage tail protein I [Laribacter hongkongensis]MCG9004603.1 phage tail protein I [Laribacter hongkongensis]MCG9007491.1 phage tail protein I [Laribacter hongkongensis]